MAGLHKREREQVFTADGWYPTGDVGWFDDDGHFYFTGRRGDLIKSRGMNVSPREVEQELEQHPEVSRAVVVGIPAGADGEDVAAAVVVGDDPNGRACAVTAAELTDRLRRTLSAYKVPRRVVLFDDADELPLLESGKVDRRTLADLIAKLAASSD
jgi:acyl-CoA synthetase (AMP-forming)/AMP-acid ligase II